MPWKEPFTAAFRFASGRTMFGFLPPSSSVTRLRSSPQRAPIRRPTSVEPVNAILSIEVESTNAAPVSPSPVSTLITPSGKPASSASWPSRIALSGVRLDQVGEPVDELRAPGGGHLAPRPLEHLAGGGRRPLHVLAARLRHLADGLAGGGIDGLERAPVSGVHPVGADQQLVRP